MPKIIDGNKQILTSGYGTGLSTKQKTAVNIIQTPFINIGQTWGAGAIGTGNGRSIVPCGYEAPPPPKKNNEADMAMAAVGIIVIGVAAYYLHTTYDFELKFDMTDNYQTYGTKKTFSLFEKNDNSLNFEMDLSHTTSDDYHSNRLFFGFSGTF